MLNKVSRYLSKKSIKTESYKSAIYCNLSFRFESLRRLGESLQIIFYARIHIHLVQSEWLFIAFVALAQVSQCGGPFR